MLCHVKELGPGWFSNPMLGNRFNGLEETLDGTMVWLCLIVDDGQAGLELFPKRWLAFLPYWTSSGGGEWLELSLEVRCSALWCPRVLLEEVLLGDRHPIR